MAQILLVVKKCNRIVDIELKKKQSEQLTEKKKQ